MLPKYGYMYDVSGLLSYMYAYMSAMYRYIAAKTPYL